jgi:hypothetical protein
VIFFPTHPLHIAVPNLAMPSRFVDFVVNISSRSHLAFLNLVAQTFGN